MNPKALLFDKFLKDEEITSFERKDFDDEDGTVVYRSYIKSPLWDMPLFVILDNSIYSVIRLVLGPEKVTAKTINFILMNKTPAYIWTAYICVVMMRLNLH